MAERQMGYKSTLKSFDTEEFIDIYFYRPVGYVEALISRKLKISPNALTIISIFFGVFGGVLFYFNDLTINIIGMVSLVFANSLDSADGQLARMTNNCTQLGRFLDGLAGNFWFIAIYIALGFRLVEQGNSNYIIILIASTALCHSIQAAMADNYRNFHLFFIKKKKFEDMEHINELNEKYAELSWGRNFFDKLYYRLTINYVNEQQMIARNFTKLFKALADKFGPDIPDDFRERFRQKSRPLMKYTNILTTNTRMIALFVALFINDVIWYAIFELTVLNLILVFMVYRHERFSKEFYKELSAENS